MPDRTATVTWKGSLTEGQGAIQSGSGALANLPVTWGSRVEMPEGKTSPEELLAAAEAECYAMVLTNMLTKAGTTPDRLEVTATCTVERQESGLKITTMRLEVGGRVPRVDQETFARTASEAEQACPVSNAIRGNVEVSVTARLTSPAEAGTR
jgi:osmotically inducible protein OsmC